MFKTIRNAFKVKELRGKILYTFMMLVVIRFMLLRIASI